MAISDVCLALVQGQELQAIQQANPQRRMIFCGDGANDLCPSLGLGPKDFVLPRKGHPLEQLIAKRAAQIGETTVVAKVLAWNDHAELFEIIRSLYV